MLRVVLVAALLVAGLISFDVAPTVDCGGNRYPPWVDVAIGSIIFGAFALLVTTGVSSSNRLPAYLAIATMLVASCAGLVLVSVDSLGARRTRNERLFG
jgi:hypothetical protein